MKNLDELRNELDLIDNNILELISKRFEVTKNVALFKKAKKLDIFQPDRERQLLKAKCELAKDFAIDEKFVTDFFQLIMDESKKRQKEVLELES